MNQLRKLAFASTLLSLGLASQACLVKVNDNNNGLSPTERVCDRFAACSVVDSDGYTFTYGSCLADYPEGTFTSSCAAAVESASCPSLYDGTSSAWDVCFSAPPPVVDPVTRFCNQMVSCAVPDGKGVPYTLSSCLQVYGNLVLPGSCPGAVEAESCAALQAGSAGAYDVCFPSCSETTCSADEQRLLLCDNQTFTLFTYDCEKVCQSTSQVYTGVCDTMYDGKVSNSGDPVCWCQ